jgi:CRISPR-associated protein Csm3
MDAWKKNIIVSGEIVVVTGLHIGGGTETVKIGGTDSPVAKTVVKVCDRQREVPYIPGSSLKGKMRTMLRAYYQESGVKVGNRPVMIDTMFGQSVDSKKSNNGPTRIIFRDSFPSRSMLESPDIFQSFTEIKAENTIRLENSQAMPRFIERVQPFTRFDMECIISVYEKDDEKEMTDLLKEGFRLMEDSYLGGNGTRGYGKIRFEGLKYEDRGREYYEVKPKG